MKKKHLFFLIIILTMIFFLIKYYFDYKTITKDSCVTVSKINNLSTEYRKIVYDEKNNLIIGGYDKLNKLFFDEITQKNKYKLYLMWGKKKVQIEDYTELVNYSFPSGIIDKYSKKDKIGADDYLIVENKEGNVVFKLKWYEIYPYKKMYNTMYSGTASIVIQFKCKIQKNR